MDFLEVTIYRIILKTHMFIRETRQVEDFEQFSYLRALTGRLTEDVMEQWQNDTGGQAQRYYGLLHRINNENSQSDTEAALDLDVLCTALDLCLAAMCVPEFAAYLNYYTGSTVTIQLAAEMEGVVFADYSDTLRRLKKLQKICRVDWKRSPLMYATVEADDVLFAYLTDGNVRDKLSPGEMEWFGQDMELQPMFIRKSLAQQGAEWIKSAGSAAKLLFLSGKGGRRFLAKHISRCLEKDLMLMDLAECKNYFGEESGHFWSRLVHVAFLQKAVVCIYGVTTELLQQTQISETDFYGTAVSPFLENDIPVILCMDSDVDLLPVVSGKKFPVRSIELVETDREEREAVFCGFFSQYHISLDCAYYSVRYRLSASEIAGAVELWRCDGEQNPERFSEICDTILYKKQEKVFGQILYPSVGFADLKLPRHMKDVLGQICSSVTDGYRIFEEWKLKDKYPYGRAVTVLLTGPPGTGKTMTAHVLAKELGIPLYKVDLSHVLDKYIGETEKHLEQIFAFAGKTNPLLFFDEADSLFGKRGEVKEGKDRYANMEVSYILQRIEQFDGIVALATNFYNNIDKAFLRRMKYVLKYQAPDAELRRSIWEDCLPLELPREDLDFDYLARQFDFTGGIIKNVVYAACVLAVHGGAKLNMEHILKAVRAEYEKMERTITRDMWGEYGYLIEMEKNADNEEE